MEIIFFKCHKYEEAQKHFKNILKKELTNDQIELAYTYYGLSQVDLYKHDYQSAISNIEKALSHLSEHSSTNDHPLISQSYNDLGSIYTKQGNYFKAFQFYDKALQTNNNMVYNTYSGLAQIHFKLSNFFLSEEYLQKALDNQPRTDHGFVANLYIELGTNLCSYE